MLASAFLLGNALHCCLIFRDALLNFLFFFEVFRGFVFRFVRAVEVVCCLQLFDLLLHYGSVKYVLLPVTVAHTALAFFAGCKVFLTTTAKPCRFAELRNDACRIPLLGSGINIHTCKGIQLCVVKLGEVGALITHDHLRRDKAAVRKCHL